MIHKTLKHHRTTKGVTQTELGKCLGISYQQIQKYESGRDRISAESLGKVAEFLGVPIQEFYGEIE